ncbi:hypothetical protein KEM60_03271 [Austwickia sp. TVS 96-490-7B]|nr:hypothetical protein [Austwickia sp. TVS 96-490-7B]
MVPDEVSGGMRPPGCQIACRPGTRVGAEQNVRGDQAAACSVKRQIAANSSGCSEAPPTRAPSTSG